MGNISVNIFRSNLGDCSAGGISANAERVLLVTEADPIPTGPNPAVMIIAHPAGPAFEAIAVPVDEDGAPMTGGMFGGTFVYASDSRFPESRPVALHDRFER